MCTEPLQPEFEMPTLEWIQERMHELFNVDANLAFDREGNLLAVHKLPEAVSRAAQAIKVEERRAEDGQVESRVVSITLYDGRILRSSRKPQPIQPRKWRTYLNLIQHLDKDSLQ